MGSVIILGDLTHIWLLSWSWVLFLHCVLPRYEQNSEWI